MKAFLDAGGEKKARKRKGDELEEGGKKKRGGVKDPGAPKKPVGGAYGVFLNEKRPEFMKLLPGQKAPAVSKHAGEQWKALSEKEKKPYVEEYKRRKAEYDEALKAYKAKG